MSTQIKDKLEQTRKNATDFLAMSREKSDFGSEADLACIAAGVGVAISMFNKYAEPQRSAEIRGLGFETIEAVKSAYRDAMNHYSPTTLGRLLDANGILF